MPKRLEHQLEMRARKLHLHGKRHDAYVYGTLRKVEREHKEKMLRHR